MGVFPEATTKGAKCLVKFRTGAFVSGEPVQPIVLRYPERLAWVETSIVQHIFRAMTQWFNFVEVTWLPVYVPNAAEQADPQLYANNVQAAMAEKLELPPESVSSTIGAKEVAAAMKASK